MNWVKIWLKQLTLLCQRDLRLILFFNSCPVFPEHELSEDMVEAADTALSKISLPNSFSNSSPLFLEHELGDNMVEPADNVQNDLHLIHFLTHLLRFLNMSWVKIWFKKGDVALKDQS